MRTYSDDICCLTGKRLLRQLPYFLAGLAVMVLLVGMAAFSASKVLYGETSLKKNRGGRGASGGRCAFGKDNQNDCLSGQRGKSLRLFVSGTR
ncbi:MAG: hypothetical protein ACLR8P_22990 [Clostridium fessum]